MIMLKCSFEAVSLSIIHSATYLLSYLTNIFTRIYKRSLSLKSLRREDNSNPYSKISVFIKHMFNSTS